MQHLKGRSTDGIAREENKAKEKKKEPEEAKRGVKEEADRLKRDRASRKKKARLGHGCMWSRA
mgnify:CR=1 FL=1